MNNKLLDRNTPQSVHICTRLSELSVTMLPIDCPDIFLHHVKIDDSSEALISC